MYKCKACGAPTRPNVDGDIRYDASKALREIERLLAVLKPFASLADKIHPSAPDEAQLVLTTLGGGIIDTNNRVTAGDLRRCASAFT